MIITIILALCLFLASFSFLKKWDRDDEPLDLFCCLGALMLASFLLMVPYESKTEEYTARTVSETKVYVPETKKVYMTDKRNFENSEMVKILVEKRKHILFGEFPSNAEIIERLK